MPSDVLGTQLLPIGLQDGPLLHWSVIAGTKIDTGAVRIDRLASVELNEIYKISP
jgi:hypothetical protein